MPFGALWDPQRLIIVDHNVFQLVTHLENSMISETVCPYHIRLDFATGVRLTKLLRYILPLNPGIYISAEFCI